MLRHLAGVTVLWLVLGSQVCAQEGAALKSAVADSEDVVVQLLEPGIEPREEIRFHPTAGSKQTVVMVMKMDMSTIVSGNKLPSPKTPAQKFTIDISVGEVTADGDASFQYVFSNIELVDDPANPSPIAGTMLQTLKPLIGAVGSGVVTNRGFSKNGEFNVPEEASPMLKSVFEGMKDTMNRFSSPVPAEPIGIGGKWRTTQQVSANGLKLEQTSIHELRSKDEKGYSVGITVTQSAQPQEVKAPHLPGKATIMLESLDSKGTGAIVLNPRLLMPTHSDMNLVSLTKMEVSVAGQKQAVSTETKMEVTVSPGNQ